MRNFNLDSFFGPRKPAGRWRKAGVIIHSKFTPKTPVEHALRDGQRFYFGDTTGISKRELGCVGGSWDERIDTSGCDCCFSQELVADEDGFVRFLPLDLTQLENGLTEICTINSWFACQPEEFKRVLLGEFYKLCSEHAKSRRYEGSLSLDDTLDIRHRQMTLDELRSESRNRRAVRRRGVISIFKAFLKGSVKSWSEGGGKWCYSRNHEESYNELMEKLRQRWKASVLRCQ